MAFLTDSIDLGTTDRKPGFWARLGKSLISARAAEGRMIAFRQLDALTDGELAARGLQREDLARHVFKDIYYV